MIGRYEVGIWCAPEFPDIDEDAALNWFVREGTNGVYKFADALKVSVDYVKEHIETIVRDFKDELDCNEDLETEAIQEYAYFLDNYKPVNDWY